MPDRPTLDIHFHADGAVTIEGQTLAPSAVLPLLEAAAKRTPPPLLNFITDHGAPYESVGQIIYQSVRAGFPDQCFSCHAPQRYPSLRPATEDDMAFLLALRQQTMHAKMIAAGETPSEEMHRERILHAFASAEIVQVGGAPVGLLKVVRSPPVWDLIQIQVAPSAQGQGLGDTLLRTLIAQALAHDASIRLSVYKDNPARRLYERLGFKVVGATDNAYDMLYQNPHQAGA